MGKTFTKLVLIPEANVELIDEDINETLEQLGNPKLIDVKVFSQSILILKEYAPC